MFSTYTMGLLVASLQVDARVIGDGAVLEFQAVIATDCPFLSLFITTWHQVSDTLQNILVNITLVTCGDHDKVDIQSLVERRLGHPVLVGIVTNVKTDTILW